jgi:hypothetical protein
MYFKKFTALTYTILLMLVISAASLSVFAQMQGPAKFEAQGQGYEINNEIYADIYLNWMYSEEVDGYNVYISYTKSDNLDDYEFLQSIDNTNDSLIKNKENYWIAYLSKIDTKNKEVIGFYITAYKGGQVSSPSNISYCYIRTYEPTYTLKFTTTPSSTAKLNEEYVYQFDIITDMDYTSIKYDLTYKPDNAIFDQDNKTIKFTPTKGGIYYFNLFVSVYGEGSTLAQTDQTWEVRVIECEKPSTISGTIRDENGDSVKYCYAVIYMVTDKGKDSTGNNYRNIQYVAQMNFENSEYSFTGLDKGTYFVNVFGYNGKNNLEFYPEWFDNAKKIEDATPIELNCDDAATANFILEKTHNANYYTVEGYVKDAATHQAIESAEVDFIGIDSITGQYISFGAYTNSNGYYDINLPDGIIYTASACAGLFTKDSNITNQDMYMPQYWNGKTDPAEADKIVLSGNLSNINFNLNKLEIYDNKVNGYVKNEDGDALLNVLMIAYIIDGSEDVNNMFRGYLAMTDNNGYFEMKNLYPAEYVLLAVPAMNITYAPGFYKENDFATLTWEDATKITVGSDGTYGAYNVKLQLFEKVIGEGIVKGIVRAETGRVKSSAEFQGKDGLQGVQVHLVDMIGNRIKSTETDKSGQYEFSGLAKGTYKVVIDKIGYKSDNFNVTIDDDTKLIDRTVTLVPAGTTAVEDNTFLLNGIGVFPNPANDMFSVKFNGDGNYAKLKLFDAQGNIVYTNVISTNVGENNYNINTDNLNSSTYFIRIEMNNSGVFTPVIIAK